MEVYKTEDEQLESIKSWLKKNMGSIFLGIAVIAGVFGGRSLLDAYTSGADETTYLQFRSVNDLRDAAMNTAEEAEGRSEAFLEYAAGIRELKGTQPNHALTSLAVLKLATDYAERDQWAEAEAELRWLHERHLEPALASLVALRLAQVLFQVDKLEEALDVIARATADEDNYLPRLKELEGDIYLDMQKKRKALQAYKAAADSNSEKGLSSLSLQWKLDDLAGIE